MKQDIRIKEICKEKGITLEDLAKRLGILRTSLSQALSRNSFSTDKLSDIATALNVPMWQLFASPEEVAGNGEFVAFIKDGREIYHVDSWQDLEKLVSNKNNGNTIS
nr:helix-turn-helix transcriptional regulator [Prevotella pallens]